MTSQQATSNDELNGSDISSAFHCFSCNLRVYGFSSLERMLRERKLFTLEVIDQKKMCQHRQELV